MAKLWWPDVCRDGQCIFDIVDGHQGVNKVIATCKHHASLGHKDDAALFEAVVATNRVMSYGVDEVARVLDVLSSSIAWHIDAADRVVITSPDKGRLQSVQAAVDVRVGVGKAVVE